MKKCIENIKVTYNDDSYNYYDMTNSEHGQKFIHDNGSWVNQLFEQRLTELMRTLNDLNEEYSKYRLDYNSFTLGEQTSMNDMYKNDMYDSQRHRNRMEELYAKELEERIKNNLLIEKLIAVINYKTI